VSLSAGYAFNVIGIVYSAFLMIDPCQLNRKLRIRPYGERAFLLEGLAQDERLFVMQCLDLNPPDTFLECVPGYDNLLVLFSRPVNASVISAWVHTFEFSSCAKTLPSRRHEVPVIYAGADLAAVAEATGLRVAEVISIHSSAEYTVRMMGFAPGFPYLDGLDKRLHLDRKASPRNRIEPGAVAIGGSHAGIYSVASPGGWHLLGRTELALFKPEKATGTSCDPRSVFTMAAGDTVKFIES
jgi:KipI family sensor histidine kinase inhibitor